MTQFEFISIAVSLVLVFGVTRLLNGLPVMLRSENPYWVHTLWTAMGLANYAVYWWVFWNYRHIEDWTLGGYLLTLLYPGLSYVGATILAPAEGTVDTDWRAYFFANRQVIFGLGIVATVTLGFVGLFLAGAPLEEVVPLVVGYTAFLAVGIASRDARVQAGLALANVAFFLAAYLPAIWT